MEEICRKTLTYNRDITAVQERRWSKSGEILKNKYMFLCSGEEWRGQNWLRFYVKQTLKDNIIQIAKGNGRIA